MDYTLQELSTLIQSSDLIGKLDVSVTHILYDSRKVIKPSTGLFVAIPGDVHDGHDYVLEAYKKGVRCFLLSKKVVLPEDTTQLIVPDVMNGLHTIAIAYRAKLSYPIIGITGSNGKTIVKEWLSTLLTAAGWKVQKSPKSYNSQLGVALSLLDFKENADIGIVEAGISQKDEMCRLEKMIQPTYGIFTNIGSAHSAGFVSREEKLSEKSLLFAHSEKVIANKKYTVSTNQVSYGGKGAFYHIEKRDNTLCVNHHHFLLPFSDNVSVENIESCVVMLLELGLSPHEINEHLSLLVPIKMRLEIKEGLYNCHIIDDSYSNDLVGIHTAFEFLEQQHFNTDRTLILSDVLQSNKNLYAEVHHLISSYAFKKVYLIGNEIKSLSLLNHHYEWFKDTDDFFEKITEEDFRDEVILVKGARTYG